MGNITDHKKKTYGVRDVLKEWGNELSENITHKFSTIFGDEYCGSMLKVYVERDDDKFNVYWKQIEEAAEYIVEVYKHIEKLNEWYKLTSICVDRNNGYVALNNLFGKGYVFRVIASDRNDQEIAKSAGIIIWDEKAE